MATICGLVTCWVTSKFQIKQALKEQTENKSHLLYIFYYENKYNNIYLVNNQIFIFLKLNNYNCIINWFKINIEIFIYQE